MSERALAKLSDQDLAQFDSLKAQVTKFVAPALERKVTDFVSSNGAVDSRKVLRSFQKDLDRTVDALVAPLKRQIEFIKGLAAEIEAPIERADTHLKNQINAFAAEQARIQEEMRRKEQERLRKEEEAAAERRRREEAAAEAKRKAELEALERARLAAQPKAETRRSAFGRNLTPDAQAEATRKAIEEKHEQERLEREARHEREKKIRESEAEGRQYDIRKSNISHTRRDYDVEVVDLNLVPVDLLKRELRIKEAKAAYKAGGCKPIPGLKFTEKFGVALGEATHVPRGLLDDERRFGRGPRE